MNVAANYFHCKSARFLRVAKQSFCDRSQHLGSQFGLSALALLLRDKLSCTIKERCSLLRGSLRRKQHSSVVGTVG